MQREIWRRVRRFVARRHKAFGTGQTQSRIGALANISCGMLDVFGEAMHMHHGKGFHVALCAPCRDLGFKYVTSHMRSEMRVQTPVRIEEFKRSCRKVHNKVIHQTPRWLGRRRGRCLRGGVGLRRALLLCTPLCALFLALLSRTQ